MLRCPSQSFVLPLLNIACGQTEPAVNANIPQEHALAHGEHILALSIVENVQKCQYTYPFLLLTKKSLTLEFLPFSPANPSLLQYPNSEDLDQYLRDED